MNNKEMGPIKTWVNRAHIKEERKTLFTIIREVRPQTYSVEGHWLGWDDPMYIKLLENPSTTPQPNDVLPEGLSWPEDFKEWEESYTLSTEET